jgi:hypothetical protein
MKNTCRILVRKSEGKKPHERPRHGWDGNIIMSLKEIDMRVDSCGLE